MTCLDSPVTKGLTDATAPQSDHKLAAQSLLNPSRRDTENDIACRRSIAPPNTYSGCSSCPANPVSFHDLIFLSVPFKPNRDEPARRLVTLGFVEPSTPLEHEVLVGTLHRLIARNESPYRAAVLVAEHFERILRPSGIAVIVKFSSPVTNDGVALPWVGSKFLGVLQEIEELKLGFIRLARNCLDAESSEVRGS